MKSIDVSVRQLIGSFPVSVNVNEEVVTEALLAASVNTGAVVSAIVTETDAGDPVAMVVRELPYSSSTLKELDARNELVPDDPGETEEVAAIVHFVVVD